MTADVAIIGVGLHPFGRFPGKSAIEMGAAAARLAMKDAGVEWRDVQFAFGGSYEVDNPDSIVNQLGHDRHPVLQHVQRLRHRGERAHPGDQHDPPRRVRHRHGDRHGQARARRVQRRPDPVQPAQLVRRGRHVPHAEVLRREDPAVHARLRHQPDHAGAGGGEELPQRRAQRERVPAHSRCRSSRSSSRGSSTTRSRSTCSARPTRAPRRSCCAVPIGRTSSPTRRSTCTPRRCAPAGSARSRCTARRSRSSESPARRSTCRGRVREGRHRARGRRRHPAAGHRRRRRGVPHGRERLLRRRRPGATARRRGDRTSTARCRSTPTAA